MNDLWLPGSMKTAGIMLKLGRAGLKTVDRVVMSSARVSFVRTAWHACGVDSVPPSFEDSVPWCGLRCGGLLPFRFVVSSTVDEMKRGGNSSLNRSRLCLCRTRWLPCVTGTALGAFRFVSAALVVCRDARAALVGCRLLVCAGRV
ncbi:hypothetical protein GPALN_004543 [Globodera pallida]|nr:hypothetical protein GPALN_004543 [Globodera pallida]